MEEDIENILRKFVRAYHLRAQKFEAELINCKRRRGA
jgi:hypothetical protein